MTLFGVGVREGKYCHYYYFLLDLTYICCGRRGANYTKSGVWNNFVFWEDRRRTGGEGGKEINTSDVFLARYKMG